MNFTINASLTISANVDLKETTGAKREFKNITVNFTPEEMVLAILHCDGYSSGSVSGMDFYVNGKTELTQTETVNNGTGTGNINISGTKTWNHGNPANPTPPNAHPTLTLYQKVSGNWVEVTGATLKWSGTTSPYTYTFTAPYVSHATEYKVVEAAVPGYTTAVGGTANCSTVVGPMTKVDSCSVGTYSNLEANFIVAKFTQHEGFMIWTARPVTDANEKLALIAAANGVYNQVTNANTTFISGNGASYNVPDKGTVTVAYNGQAAVTFATKAVWAKFAYGTMTTTCTPANGNFTNTYNAPNTILGSLKISKVLAGATPTSVTFNVTGPNSYSQNVTLTGTETTPWSTTLTGLAAGNYTITELNAGVTGYTYTTAYSGDSTTATVTLGSTTDSQTNVTTVNAKTVTVTNTYTPLGEPIINPATLTIHKIDKTTQAPLAGVEFGLFEGEAANAYLTKKTDGNGDAIFTLGAEDEGSYKLRETKGLNDYSWNANAVIAEITVSLKNGDPTLTLNEPGGFWQYISNWFVEKDNETPKAAVTIEVENEKIPTGTLTVTKEVAGAGASETRNFNFKIEFDTMVDDVFVPGTAAEDTVTFSLKHNETKTFAGILAGTVYHITETDVPGYTQSIKSGAATGTMSADGAAVTFLNTHREDVPADKGFFDVKKVDADNNEITLAGAIFRLVTDDQEGTLVAEQQTNGSGIATFGNLEDGDYILTEAYAPADYYLGYGYWEIKVADGIVYIGQEVINTLRVENEKKPVQLTVTKNVVGNRAKAGEKFDFTVTLANVPSFALMDAVETTTESTITLPADGTWTTNKGQSDTWSFGEGYTAVIHVQLVDDEILTVNGLTPWMTYSVKETLLSDYTTSATVNGQAVTLENGAILDGEIGYNEQEVIQNPNIIFTNDAGNSRDDRDRNDDDDDNDNNQPIPIPEPEFEVPEGEVPLAPEPPVEIAAETVEIPEAAVPLGDMTTPQTGDNSNTALFALMAALSAIGLGALVFGKRNKNEG